MQTAHDDGAARRLLAARVLVTGGAGFIGSHVVDALYARDVEVAVLDDLSSGRRTNVPPQVPLFEVDLRDGDAVRGAFRTFKPTHVVHQAAQASVKVSVDEPLRDAAVNVMGGLRLLEAAREFGVGQVVVASTGGAIYGEVPEGARAEETWPPKPESPYAASKAAFDHYVDVYRRQYGLTCTVLRYGNVYGPRQDPMGEAGVVAIFAHRLLDRRPVTLFARREPGDDGCVRDYVWVGDVVDANIVALEKGLDGVFNVGTGEGHTTRAVLGAIERAVGVKASIDYAPPRQGDLERSVISAARLQSHGWRPRVTLTDGIARTVSWFKEEGRTA